MRIYSTFIFIIACLSFLFPLASFSQQAPQGEFQVVRKTILDFKQELKLTEKQVKEIEKLLQVYFKKEQEMLGKIREKETKLTEMLNSDGDIKEVKKLAREIYCLRGELRAEELETAKKIDGILNEEQRKRWKEIRLGRR